MLSGSFREKLLWKIGKSWLENTCAGTSFLIKLLILNLAHILAHAFFLEFCRIVKKACFKQHLWRAASGNWQYSIPLLVSVFRNGVFNNFAKFLDKKLTWGLFYSKVAGFKPATLLKIDSDTSAFLWILQNFWKSIFRRTSGTTASENCQIFIPS